MPSKRERKLISKNRSAHHEYFIDETFECGIELSGTEVKVDSASAPVRSLTPLH